MCIRRVFFMDDCAELVPRFFCLCFETHDGHRDGHSACPRRSSCRPLRGDSGFCLCFETHDGHRDGHSACPRRSSCRPLRGDSGFCPCFETHDGHRDGHSAYISHCLDGVVHARLNVDSVKKSSSLCHGMNFTCPLAELSAEPRRRILAIRLLSERGSSPVQSDTSKNKVGTNGDDVTGPVDNDHVSRLLMTGCRARG